MGEQHVREDFGRIPTAQDWLLQIKPERNPKDIQGSAIQQKVLAHMHAAERGFRRLDAARENVGPEALTRILRSLKLQSIDLVDNLQTLREIVLALEIAAEGKQ